MRESLPGPAAHALLAPRPLRELGWNPTDARHAAGLLLLFPVENRPHLVLTVRSDRVGHHRGQVSLPGGEVEVGETVTQAALREAREEIALDTQAVRILGELTPLDIPVSGFRLHPVIGATGAPPLLAPSDREVSRIIEVSLDALTNPSHLAVANVQRAGLSLTVPSFRIAGEEIWGATAMVLAEFLVLLGWRPELAESLATPQNSPVAQFMHIVHDNDDIGH